MRKNVRRSVRLSVLVAICLCLLCTGALAAYLSVHTDFFQTAFGRDPVEAVTETDEEGKIIKDIPAMERTAVDEAQAEALLGTYMESPAEPYTVSTHSGEMTIEVLGNIYDAATGTGVLAFSLEREAGFPEITVLDTNRAHFTGDGLMMLVGDGEATYYDSAKSTATKAFLSTSYIQIQPQTPTLYLYELLPVARLDDAERARANPGEEYVEFELLRLSLDQAQAMPSRTFARDGQEAVHISAVGMKLELPALGLYNHADDFEVKKIAIVFESGEEYLVMDREGRVANTEYGLIPEDGAYASYCFNRPIDIGQVKRIEINGQALSAQ